MSAKMRAAVLSAPGPPENLKIGEVSRPLKKNEEVLVRVKASALNRSDLLQRQGSYAPPPGTSEILGLEISGIIEEEEESSNKKWRKGDRVMGLLSGGGYAEYVAIRSDHLMKIPDNLNFEEAAAIPEVWLTSYQLLHELAAVKKGDSVLIHAGASGIGTAAIQLAVGMGASPIATVGTPDKMKAVISLGASHAINYKSEDFSLRVAEITHGAGVDVILDPIGGSNFDKNIASIARDGRWILFGLMGGKLVEKFDLSMVMGKRLRLEGTTLRSRTDEYKAHLIESFWQHAQQPFEKGTYKPIVHCVMPFLEISSAHRLMESNVSFGKIVLLWDADSSSKI